MSETTRGSRRRVASLERRATLFVICCGVLAAYLLLFAARGVVKADAQPGDAHLETPCHCGHERDGTRRN